MLKKMFSIETEKDRKKFLIYLFSFLAIISITFFGILGLIQGRIQYSIFIFSFLGLAIVNLVFLSITGKTKIATHFVLFFMSLLELKLFAGLIPGTSGIFWFFIFPPLAVTLLGNKKGSIYSLILIASIIIIYNFFPALLSQDYNKELILRFIFSYIVLVAMVNLFEYSRNSAYTAYVSKLEEIQEKNEELLSTEKELSIQNIELQASRDELSANEEKFRTVADYNYDMEYWVSPEQKIIYISPSSERITGYSVDEFYKNPELMTDMFHPEDKDFAISSIASLVAEKKLNTVEFRIITKNNEIRWIGHVCQEIYNNQGVSIGFRASNRDITDRKKIEQEILNQNEKLLKLNELLQEKEERLSTIINNQGEGFGILDRVGNFIFANPAACNIFGLEKDKLIGRNLKEFLTLEEWTRIRNITTEQINDKYNCPLELTLSSTEKKYLIFTGVPDFDKNNKVIGTIGTFRDITELKKIELSLKVQNHEFLCLNEEYKSTNEQLLIAKDKAEESDRLKSAFLANMSHEIRTPLNSIIGFAEILKRSNLTDEQRHKYLGRINTGGKHLVSLISDIIDVSKIDANQLVVIEKEFNLNSFIYQICEEFKEQIVKGVDLIIKPGLKDKNDLVTTDDIRLKQILKNLLANAVKFTSSGEIEIGYRVVEENVLQFYVKDSGIGISEKDLPIIFNRFRQADETTTRKYGGTGLGLAVSKGCVELLDGSIWVESSLGKGSTFFFTIKCEPISNNKSKKTIQKNLKTENIFKGKTILIVEDEVYNYEILELYLENTNARLIYAENGIDAIQNCKQNPEIDIVLMDIQLPKLDGLSATKEILKFRSDLPIISQTANAMREDELKSIEAGCVNYITKPINEQELIDKIAQYIFKSN